MGIGGMAGLVLCEKRADGVAVVTLNRPEAMNALSVALRQRLCAVMRELPATGLGAVRACGRKGADNHDGR